MRATVDRPGLDSQGRSPLIKIRRVRKGDLSKVRDVLEQAFSDFFERQVGTRPRQVFGGAQYVHHRWLMEPWGCFVAEEGDGKIVGAAIAVMWGTLGLVGPIAVLPNYQNQDIGQQLLTACQGFFDENKAALQGLATYPSSAKHLLFYQKFGYRPRGLVMIAQKPLDRREIVQATRPAKPAVTLRRYSTLEESRKKATILKLRRITNGILRGMDLGKEVEIVDGLALGDTLLLEKGRELIGFAIYHVPGVSEAPQGSLYVKFLAVDQRHKKVENLHGLLAGLEDLAHELQLQRVVAPAYTYYWTAYQALRDRGYQIDFTMVRMKRGKATDDDEDSGSLVLDDWR
jgi:ribosomal protein S18 acetylase RimI-like enzyme